MAKKTKKEYAFTPDELIKIATKLVEAPAEQATEFQQEFINAFYEEKPKDRLRNRLKGMR